jgi:hypothetical protein
MALIEIKDVYKQLAYKYLNNKYGTTYEDRSYVFKEGGNLIPKHQYGNEVVYNWESTDSSIKPKAEKNNMSLEQQKARDKYEIKLFANQNFIYISLEGTGETRPVIYIKDFNCWNSFIDYLVLTHSLDYEVYRELFTKFKNTYVIVYGDPIMLKTTKEYAKELEEKKKSLQKYITRLKTNTFMSDENSGGENK